MLPIFLGRPTTLNGKSQMTPLKRHGTASETTPRITTHRRPVARPRALLPEFETR